MKRYYLSFIWLAAACSQPHPAIVFPDGGYPYATHIMATDSNYYYLPVKGQVARRDSLAYEDGYLYFKSYDEPNLSLAPLKKPVFRLVNGCALCYSRIITLQENELIVKKGVKGNEYPMDEDNLLTETERQQYYFLRRWYPLNDTARKRPRTQRYIDSMVKTFPPLATPAYYRYLIDKIRSKHAEPLVYTVKRMPLTAAQYQHFVTAINQSGYWKFPFQMPYYNAPMDGEGYTLEANTPKRYNIVYFGSGDYDSLYIPFTRLCFELCALAEKAK